MDAQRAASALLASLLIAATAVPLAADDPAPAPTPEAVTDPRAAEVAERVAAALGGAAAWQAAGVIRFAFAGRRRHVWDRAHDRHRVEGTTEGGETYVVVHDLASREGRAWVDGEPVTGEQLVEMLDDAWAAWVNDTYWLVMPYKLRDPGVTLSWEGEEELDGRPHDRLALSFAGVGLTPGDRYWAWIDRESGLMSRWGYVLQHQPADAEPTLWDWRGWRGYGGIMLSPERILVGGDRTLELAPIEVLDRVPEALFEAP